MYTFVSTHSEALTLINLNAPTRVCEAIDHSQIIAGEEEEKWKRTEEDWEEDFRRQ